MDQARRAPQDDHPTTVTIPRRPRVSVRRQVPILVRGLAPPPRPSRYIIYGQGRSGSTVLGSLLASHPQVEFADEILYRPVISTRLWARGLRNAARDRVWGFHVKPYQLTIQQDTPRPDRWIRRMVAEGWTLIYLERQDVVRQVISNAVASARGTYHALAGEELPAARPVVDIDAFLEVVRARLRMLDQDRAAVADLPHELVIYERDLRDPERHQATADRLFAALGVETTPVHTPLRRTSTEPWTDIANWPEIVAALQAAGLGSHVEDDTERT